jgi:phosphoglycolate phosphatase
MLFHKSPDAYPINVSVIAFDLDGTLADTLPDLCAATNRLASDLGRGPVSEALVGGFVGRGIEHLVIEFLGHAGLRVSSSRQAQLVSRFKSHYAQGVCDNTRLFLGVRETLEQLTRLGFSLACLTNKSKAFTLPILKKLEIECFFKRIICGDSLARRKPDPLPLEHLADYFDVNTSQVLLVGDSVTDTQCARNANSPVFCVPYGYRSGMGAEELDCDVLIDDVRDILNLVKN